MSRFPSKNSSCYFPWAINDSVADGATGLKAAVIAWSRVRGGLVAARVAMSSGLEDAGQRGQMAKADGYWASTDST